MTHSHASTSSQPALGWALFLGCSWTWVIGMFLPVLLIRDYGFMGWLIFAVPNCLGAAAMGWVMRTPEHSTQMVQKHRVVCELFSQVTIAFHVYFVLWMVWQMVGNWALLLAMALIQLSFTPIPTGRRSGMWAGVTILASLMIAGVLASRGALVIPGGTADWQNLTGLGAVCIMGFLACPYFDLTFHQARQACERPRDSRIAFGVGFCVVFFSMIVLTLLYAMNFNQIVRTLGAAMAIHVGLQAVFTVNVHALALRSSSSEQDRTGVARAALGFWLAVAAGVWLIARLLAESDFSYARLSSGEIGYRLFLSFYGLLFPAYAWLCMLPCRAGGGAITRALIARWLIACALALPFYWIAFMERQMPWVLIGIAIILAARLVPVRTTEIAHSASELPHDAPTDQ